MTDATWPLRPLGRCVKFLSGGTPNKARPEFWEGDIPWVSSGEMTERHINDTSLHISEDGARQGSQLVPENTVLAVVRGMSLATEFRVAITKRVVAFNQDLKALQCEPGIDPEFLFYALLARRDHIKDLASEASHGTKRLETEVLGGVGIPMPRQEEVQRRVVALLSAYDDLIENNRRRMALLEEAARQLHREWFVRLRFPGHEHPHIIDGLPDGWSPKALGDFCVEVRESVVPDAVEPDSPYIGLEHMPRRSISLAEWGGAAEVTSSKHRFRQGEILFGKIRPYFHKVGVAFVDGVASSDAIVIRPNAADLHALVLMTVSSDPFVAMTAQTVREGSKMPRADWKHMRQYPVALPPHGLLTSFQSFVSDAVRQLRTLAFANQKLRAARDLLLPRLMSGEIAV